MKNWLKIIAYIIGFLVVLASMAYGIYVEYLKLMFLMHFAH